MRRRKGIARPHAIPGHDTGITLTFCGFVGRVAPAWVIV
jgi:hypothetical protein